LGVVVNVTLLLWVYRADRVTLHWPRRVQSVFVALRSRGSLDGKSPGSRRPLYVADRGVARDRTPSIGGASQPISAQQVRAAAIVPSAAPRPAMLPPDLAEILSRPAAVALAGDFPPAGELPREEELPPGEGSGRAGEDGLARAEGDSRVGGAARLAVDTLTGLEGPASWGRIVDIENARLLRYRRPVTVVMAEVEGLQRLAERLGNGPVDRLLPVIADVLHREARSSDWVARLGTGRFAAFLPETDEIQAINYIERIRVACEPWLASSAVPMRLAIGWSSPGASADLEQAIAQAEVRMHSDRRVRGKLPQAPRSGATRVFSLAADRPAADGLPDLTAASVAPAEKGRPTGQDGYGLDDLDEAVEPGEDPIGGRGWNTPGEAAGAGDGSARA
jgi:diguanylate cyclase (GGDEF)-like protein